VLPPARPSAMTWSRIPKEEGVLSTDLPSIEWTPG
jgi:hypothetical protein